MQLMIDIHEKDYQSILNSGQVPYDVVCAIMNGTPLPKGHGKIMDSNEFNHYLISRDSSFKALIAEIPPIIEADKGEEDGTNY